MGDFLARIIGLTSIIVGILTLLMATFSYFKKGKDINHQTFTFPKLLIIFLSFLILLIFLVFGGYYLFAWALI